jgi:hypothetical protein
MIDDDLLASALHELAGQEDAGVPPVGPLLRRGRRARRTRLALFATVGVAGVTGGAVLATGAPGPSGSAPVAEHPPNAGHVSLALAAQTTQRSTFRVAMKVILGNAAGPSSTGPSTYVTTYEGAFDPANKRGYLKSTSGNRAKFSEERTLGNQCFTRGPNAKWITNNQPCLGIGMLATGVSTATDPASMLNQLKSLKTTTYSGRTGSGSAAVDTWKITYTQRSTESTLTDTGTVTVNVATSQVATLSIHESSSPSTWSDVSLDFSGYGQPVDVVAPH